MFCFMHVVNLCEKYVRERISIPVLFPVTRVVQTEKPPVSSPGRNPKRIDRGISQLIILIIVITEARVAPRR